MAARRLPGAPLAIREAFHLEWTVRGHRIRELVADDRLLAQALQKLLPKYTGAGLTLYRGERASERAHRRYGFAWTPVRDTAAMFAGGLCTLYPGGGVLLKTDAPAVAILAGPSPHSLYLDEQEFVVDRRKLSKITEIARYPERMRTDS